MRRSAISAALARAVRERRLVLLLWVLTLVPAIFATVPVAAFLDQALARTPAGDALTGRFDLTILVDLFQSNRATFRLLGPLFGLVVAASFLANAFFAGGALEVLLQPDRRALALRFGRGGGRYFARFLRMGFVAVALSLLLGGLLSAPIWAVRSSLSFRAEGAKFWLGLLGVAVALFGVAVGLLALDLARIAVARDDSRKAVRTLLRSVVETLRRPAAPITLWLGLGGLWVLAAGLLSGARSAVGLASGGALVASLLLLQVALATRAFYRVALWSGEIALRPLESGGSRIRA